MKLRSLAICLGVVFTVTSLPSTAVAQSATKTPVLDADGCIDGERPVILELGLGDQLRCFGVATSSVALKKNFDIGWSIPRESPKLMPPVLLVAGDDIPERRVNELFKLCTESHFTRIVRVKSYPDSPTKAANPALAAPAVQIEKLGKITREAGLTFPSSTKLAEFYETADTWWAKVLIPKASFAEFKETILKKGDSAFPNDSPGGPWKPRWWNPVNSEFKRMTIGCHFVYGVETVATKEDDNYAIFMACECH